MSADVTKYMRELMRDLSKQGFEVSVARSGHYRVQAPTGATCHVAVTPGSRRSVLNQITRLKRIGYLP